MKTFTAIALGSLLLAAVSFTEVASAATDASSACETKAVGKDGKPLAGAAKNSFMKKCEADNAASTCSTKAMDKNGKPLAGAAKTSFMKKCEADAKTAK